MDGHEGTTLKNKDQRFPENPGPGSGVSCQNRKVAKVWSGHCKTSSYVVFQILTFLLTIFILFEYQKYVIVIYI